MDRIDDHSFSFKMVQYVRNSISSWIFSKQFSRNVCSFLHSKSATME